MAVSRLSQTSLQNAFQKFNNTWDGKSAAGGMDALGTVLVTTSGASTANFTNIPQTYSHLQLRFYIVSSGSTHDLSWILNGVSSGTSYAFHSQKTDGTTVSQQGYSSQPYGYMLKESAEYSGFTSGNVMTGIIDLQDYTSTTKNKTMRAHYGTEQNGSGFLKIFSCLYASTTAITSLQMYNGYATWGAGSQFSLYGIK